MPHRNFFPNRRERMDRETRVAMEENRMNIHRFTNRTEPSYLALFAYFILADIAFLSLIPSTTMDEIVKCVSAKMLQGIIYVALGAHFAEVIVIYHESRIYQHKLNALKSLVLLIVLTLLLAAAYAYH